MKTFGEIGGEISEATLANHETTGEELLRLVGGGIYVPQQAQDAAQDLYECRMIGTYQYDDTAHVCAHPELRARNGGGVECPSCGIFVSDLALKRIGTPRYDPERMKLADECGRLRSENDALLRENRTLRLRAEAAERRRR